MFETIPILATPRNYVLPANRVVHQIMIASFCRHSQYERQQQPQRLSRFRLRVRLDFDCCIGSYDPDSRLSGGVTAGQRLGADLMNIVAKATAKGVAPISSGVGWNLAQRRCAKPAAAWRMDGWNLPAVSTTHYWGTRRQVISHQRRMRPHEAVCLSMASRITGQSARCSSCPVPSSVKSTALGSSASSASPWP